eukprot:610912-Rhodomonas_salina.2
MTMKEEQDGMLDGLEQLKRSFDAAIAKVQPFPSLLVSTEHPLPRMRCGSKAGKHAEAVC